MALLSGLLLLNCPERIIKPRIHNVFTVKSAGNSSEPEYFFPSLDGMLVHRRVTPRIKFAVTHLYTGPGCS